MREQLTWRLDADVVVGVDADLVLLEVECELAVLGGAQLVVALQVGPAPQPAVDHVGQALPVRHLQPAVQRPATHREQRSETGPFVTAGAQFVLRCERAAAWASRGVVPKEPKLRQCAHDPR